MMLPANLAFITPGTVLLDNTTVYGARYAYETWPPKPNDWLEGAHSVNLRSLMDVLEAIVLYDKLITDASSRTMVYGDITERETIWGDLSRLKNRYHGPILEDVGMWEIAGPVAVLAFERLLRHLRSGTFVEEIQRFRRVDIDFVVPDFYRSTDEFCDLFRRSLPGKEVPVEVEAKLQQVRAQLVDATIAESNYAMFAFRGFYYRELASLLCISYSPHTWRANLINTDTALLPIGARSQEARTPQSDFLARLHRSLTDRFNEEELRTLCFDIGLDYESLPAQGKAGKARELVAEVERGGGIIKLITQCRLLRPNASWEDMPEMAPGAGSAHDDDLTERLPMDFARYVTKATSQVRQELALKLNQEFGKAAFTGSLPVIATYIAHQCRHRKQLLDVALQLRESRAVIALRAWIAQIQSSITSQSDLLRIERATAELETVIDGVRRELGLPPDTAREKLNIRLAVPTGIFGVDIPLLFPSVPPAWARLISHRRPYLLFLREITKKSVSLSPFALRYHQLQ